MSRDFGGKTALVTGAGAGIGRACALRLAVEGARLAVNDIDPGRADSTVAEIGAAGGAAVALPGDVSDPADVGRICDGAGAVDILVNNAGHVHQSLFQDIGIGEFDRMLAVHLRGAFLVAQAVVRSMLAAKRGGVVVNVASQLGQIGGVQLSHYSAAKAGIIGMTKAMARELSPAGIRVNAVAPGPINTELVLGLSAEWRDAKAAGLPLGRFGEPEDVAATVSFLASDDAAIYVGQTLGPNSGDVML